MKIVTELGDMLHSLVRRPVTERYPFERQATPEHLRGLLSFTPQGCTGCALCVKDCPANAIEMITIDKAKKRFVVRYHMDRCTFCAQCVQNCRFDCLKLSSERWELAALQKEPFTVMYGDQADVEIFLARAVQGDNGKSAKATPAA